MMYTYDKDAIKESLTIEQMFDLLSELGGEPIMYSDYITARTICHGGDSHKLYYYDNTNLFRCYTGCDEPVFDIYELVLKIKSRENSSYQLPQAIQYVASYFGFSASDNFERTLVTDDWKYFQKYDRIKDISLENKIVELKFYDGTFLQNFPRPIILPWLKDNISQEIMNYYDICYDPLNYGIVIPHYDINGNLIGVRERTLIEERAERYGKYLPMKFNGEMYNHPLSFARLQ